MLKRQWNFAWLLCAIPVAIGLVWLIGPVDQENASPFGLPAPTAGLRPLESSATQHLDARQQLVHELSLDQREVVLGQVGPAAGERETAGPARLSLIPPGTNMTNGKQAQSEPRSEAEVAHPESHWTWQDLEGMQRWHYGGEESPDLRGSDFQDAELAYADLARADLRDANLTGADLHLADLRGADLRGATIEHAYLYLADLREAVLAETHMGPVNLSKADLRGVDLQGARLACTDCPTWSTVMFSNLMGADLKGAQFGRTRIDGSTFVRADLRGADLSQTRGEPRSLQGALYDQETRLPERIDPEQWDMALYVEE